MNLLGILLLGILIFNWLYVLNPFSFHFFMLTSILQIVFFSIIIPFFALLLKCSLKITSLSNNKNEKKVTESV